MRYSIAILCALAGLGITEVNAQTATQRPYGSSSAYGASPNTGGSNAPYGTSANSIKSFTGAGSTTSTNNAAPTANTNSSDYQRMMNAANSSTDNVDNGSGNGVDNSTTGTDNGQPALATPPSMTSTANGAGYNNPLGGVTTTSPTGTTGLGAYNQSPYATGQVTAPAKSNAAPGPSTPVYEGTKE